MLKCPMWDGDAKGRAARAAARVLSESASSDRLMRWFARFQHFRTVFDEAEDAFWHLTSMPSRRDVRRIARQIASLRRRVAELDQALARLELRADARHEARNGARPSDGT